MKKVLISILIALSVIAWGTMASADYIDLPVKWSQLPMIPTEPFQAADAWLSVHRTNGPVVSNDWMCDQTGNIVAARWWGAYGPNTTWRPTHDPSNPFDVAFELAFHWDVPANVDEPFSHPTTAYEYQTVWAQEVLVGQYDAYYEGQLYTFDLYRYDAYLVRPWYQEEGNIYWLDVALDPGRMGVSDVAAFEWLRWKACDVRIDKSVQTLVPNLGNPHTGTWTPIACADVSFELMGNVPIPGAVWLLGSGLLGLVGLARRRFFS